MTERVNIKGLQVDKTLYDFFGRRLRCPDSVWMPTPSGARSHSWSAI